ncbi:MAG: PEP-CTERM sorting domain-containing protein, partial [Akkermansiaceae bacterium]
DPRPNSDAMLALFDASAVLLGDRILNVLDFETTNLGLFLNLFPADTGVAGLSILASAQSSGVDTEVTVQTSPGVEGFNTTAAGSRFLKIEEDQPGAGVEPPVGITFDFATPVVAFGAYFTGADPGVAGAITAIFDNGQSHTIPINGSIGGGSQFWGFTSADPNAGISRVTILASPELGVGTDVIGIDEVRWVFIPEPGMALLLVLSGLIVARRRRQPSRYIPGPRFALPRIDNSSVQFKEAALK